MYIEIIITNKIKTEFSKLKKSKKPNKKLLIVELAVSMKNTDSKGINIPIDKASIKPFITIKKKIIQR